VEREDRQDHQGTVHARGTGIADIPSPVLPILCPRLFSALHGGLRLKRDTFFWMQAWKRGMVGIWEDYGPTSLTFLEYLLIGVASDRFPGILLNNEGVNRSAGTGDVG
jgi:hypothetical protein